MMECHIKEMRISGMNCRLYLPTDYEGSGECYPVIYVNGEIPLEEILAKMGSERAETKFRLLSVKPEIWNDDFTPWGACPFRAGEEAPQGRADIWLSRLTGEIKPYMDVHYRTKPEPEYTALFGYSLGGLTAVYSIYKTDIFGTVASLSGSLWFDGFCEFMEREKPLRTDMRVYFSLGKKESRSKNPRMCRVAECTKRAREILARQLGRPGGDDDTGEEGSLRTGKGNTERVYFEWNEGGHFHDIEGRFAKAIAWWLRVAIADARRPRICQNGTVRQPHSPIA